MSIQGSGLSLPISAARGTLATISSRVKIVEQSIISIIETRQGERVMLPGYGMPDLVFAVVDAGFASRFAYYVEQQIKNYEPLVLSVKVRAGSIDEGGLFDSASNPHKAALQITYTVRGSNVPNNLVYPVWRLRAEVQQ
jgi:phage baseplate assembly protein W